MSASRAALLGVLAELARRRLAVGAVALVTVMLGAAVVAQMPLQLLPDIRYPHIRIIGDIPGQTSRVIEENVNEPLEAELEGVQGLVQMQSRSGDGRAYLDLYFEPGHNLDRALREVTQAVERTRAQMPEGIPPPRVFEMSTMEEPVLQFAFGSASLSAPEIRQRLRASLLPRLRAIPGVDAVHIGREEIPELVVDVDPGVQSALGLSFQAIESMLLEATDPPQARIMQAADFEALGVIGDEGWDAARLRNRYIELGDTGLHVPMNVLAAVTRGSSEVRLRTRLDGQSAVLVTVHRSPRAHALRVSRDVRATVSDVMKGAAAASDLESTLLFDDSVVTRSAVRSVVVAALGGALLAMGLLALALRNRRHVPLVALIVATSMAASVTVLHAAGMTLNLLTLAGLLLSVGLGLDYAIIYLDRLDRHTDGSSDAHLSAFADVAGPLFGALLTTVAAVVPFLFVDGLVAALFEPLIWTVVTCAAFSFLFAAILLPTFARAGPHSPAETGSRVSSPDRWRFLHHPVIAAAGVVLLGAVLVFGGRALPFEVLPSVDDGLVGVRITHPAGISADDMDALARLVEGQLAGVPGTAAVFTTVGGYFREGLPAFRPATANFMLRVDPDEAGSSAAWAQRARRAIADLDVLELGVSTTLPRIRGVQTRLTDADLVVVLTHESGDLLALTEVESEVARRLEGVTGLVDIERVRSGVSPRWVLTPRFERLAGLSVDAAVVRRAVSYALEGEVLRQRMHRGEPLALRVRYDRRYAGAPHDLESLRLPTNGADVHLADLVDFELAEEPTHIERREGQRVVRVAAQLDPSGPAPGVVAREVTRALSDQTLPSGVSWWLEGEIDALEETRRTFAMAIAMALLMVLTLLVIQYGSIVFAVAGLVSIPITGAGTVLLLAAMTRPLDAMVLAGLLIAVGIVANNVILVLSEARRAQAGDNPLSLSEALRLAAGNRLRPITLTVLSTVIGVSPLLLGGAEVFGMLQPLAIAVTGALLLSIPVACVVLPAIVVSLAALQRWITTVARGPGGAQPW